MDDDPPSAKRQKLNHFVDPDRIPDELLLKIFHDLDVSERMRLSFVSKRIYRLVYSKSMWTNIDLLTLNLNEVPYKGQRSITINGRKFNAEKRTEALEMFVELCAPFNRVHITVDSDHRDLQLMERFLCHFQKQQHSEMRNEIEEFEFNGPAQYATVAFPDLLAKGGKEQKVTLAVERGRSQQWVIDVDQMWGHVGLCTGIAELHLKDLGRLCQSYLFPKSAVAALSGKPALKTLTIQAGGAAGWIQDQITQVVDACPALVNLQCKGSYSMRPPPFTSEAFGRLLHFDMDFYNYSYEIRPSAVCSLPPKLRSLTYSMVDAGDNAKTVIVPLIKSFLEAWHLERSDRVITLDFKWRNDEINRNVFKTHDLFPVLQPICDNVVMATDERVAFVKGSVVVACKFMGQFMDDWKPRSMDFYYYDSSSDDDEEDDFSNGSDDDDDDH